MTWQVDVEPSAAEAPRPRHQGLHFPKKAEEAWAGCRCEAKESSAEQEGPKAGVIAEPRAGLVSQQVLQSAPFTDEVSAVRLLSVASLFSGPRA